MADFAAYSPYTGAGNLALAMGANPNFGGSVGGYGGSTGGYGGPSPPNVGSVEYANQLAAAEQRAGGAGIQAYNPAIASPASFQAPTFGNTMGGGAAFGGTASSAGPGMFGNTIDPQSWNQIAASTRANQNPNMFAGGTSSMWGGGSGGGGAWGSGGGGGYSGGNAWGGGGGWDPLGTGYQATNRLLMGAGGGGATFDPYASPFPSGGWGGGGPGRSPSGPSSVSNTLAGMAGNAYGGGMGYPAAGLSNLGWPTGPASPAQANDAVAGYLGSQRPTNWGLINNNPGNLNAGGWTSGQPGYTGVGGGRTPGFAMFSDMGSGFGAMQNLLSNIYGPKGLNTPSSIMNVYAPPSENNTAAYARMLGNYMGVSPTTQMNMTDPATLNRLGAGIASYETATPFSGIESAVTNAPQNQVFRNATNQALTGAGVAARLFNPNQGYGSSQSR